MRALRLLDWKSEPVIQDVDEPTAGPGQVVIKVGGAGACHSDIHLMDEFEAGAVPWNPPFTLGHENAGWVHSVGDGVRNLESGQPVAVYGPWGCGTCVRCLAGFENYCENVADAPVPGGGGGLGLDGGMAEYMLIPSPRFLVPLPEGLTPAQAAPLTDAALTPYHAIRRSLPKLAADSHAVVIGVGGLGHMAVQILKAITGASVIAVDTRAEALKVAEAEGADMTFLSEEGTADQIREATGGRGADVIIDCVGAEATLAMGAAAARQMGDLTIVGIAGGTLPVSFFSIPYEVSVQTTYWGARQELLEVLSLGSRGLIESRTTEFPLEDAMKAYTALKAGEIDGRAVIVPNEKA